ncbi:transaldolase [bacterium]|nr:transaldolase [bacterium]
MKIFLDTAKIEEINKWIKSGVIDGVTTNPSIMLKDGISNIRASISTIAAALGDKPVSIEVTTDDPVEVLSQARNFASWAENIVVKIPVIDARGNHCLDTIHRLEKDNIRVNVTAVMSFNQALMAAKAGATYVSIFFGRVCDEGHDAQILVQEFKRWILDWNYRCQIIVGSIRSVMDIQKAATAGAHIITIPPNFLTKMCDHMYTRETVRMFLDDSQKSTKPR